MEQTHKSTQPGRLQVQSVARALDLLEVVAAAGGVISISQAAEQTGLAVGTIHRLAQTLVLRGYLRQLPDRRYCLGSRLVLLGASANALIASRARPVLADLAAELGETANLAVLSGSYAEYLGQVAGTHSMRMFTEVGHRVPLSCTGVGKALLALLTDDEVCAMVQRVGMPAKTSESIVSVDALLVELSLVRSQGYALDEGEMELGVRCVAVSVDVSSMLALSVSGPSIRMTEDLVARCVAALQHASRRLSAILFDQ